MEFILTVILWGFVAILGLILFLWILQTALEFLLMLPSIIIFGLILFLLGLPLYLCVSVGWIGLLSLPICWYFAFKIGIFLSDVESAIHESDDESK